MIKQMEKADLEILSQVLNRNRRGLTQPQAVQIYNLYVKYVDNKASVCFGCGDKDAKQYLETLEQLYMKKKEPTISDADFKLKANIKWMEQGLCAFCGAKDGLIETDMVGVNIRVNVCKTNCGYTLKK